MSKPPSDLTVPVQLLPVVVPLIASPGDHLMLFNGVCVGISTAQPSALPTLGKAIARAGKRLSKAAKQRSTGSRINNPKNEAAKKEALKILEKATKPLTIGEILPSANTNLRYYVSRALINIPGIRVARDKGKGQGGVVRKFSLLHEVKSRAS